MNIQRGLFLVIIIIITAGSVFVECGMRHQYGKLGSTVKLTCGSPEGHEEPLVWKHDGQTWTTPTTPVPPLSSSAGYDVDDGGYSGVSSSTDYDDDEYDEYDGDEMEVLTLRNVNMSSRGIYSCHTSPTTEPLDEIALLLGHPPTKPTITCRSFDYPESFECEWRAGRDTFLNTSYNASFTNPRDVELQACPATGPMSCRVHQLVMFSANEYGVEVVATNVLGSARGVVFFNILDIIIPDPPENITAQRTCASVIRVVWQKPHRWTKDGAFFLMYKLKISTSAAPGIEIDVPEEDIKLVTCDPAPTLLYDLPDSRLGTEYHVQMAAFEGLGDGSQSEWSEPVPVSPVTGSSCPVAGTPTPTPKTQSLRYRDSLMCAYEEEAEDIATTTEETTTTSTTSTTTSSSSVVDTAQPTGDGGSTIAGREILINTSAKPRTATITTQPQANRACEHPALPCILIAPLSILLLR
ncbi:unnamed protein product [Lampetra fluviatilis]